MITSVYIHIPFCKNICTYCDFCKRYYNEKSIKDYLDSLEQEIREKYKNEKIKTLYIGGGTPSSLSITNLKKLMEIIKLFNFSFDYEFTFECNPENITEEKLIYLKQNGVNRISLGIESTNDEILKYLGRNHNFKMAKEKIDLIKKIGIENINVDLIYAVPGETLDDLKSDLNNIINLGVKHISTYSLEIHDNTILKIKNTLPISDIKDRQMYDYICEYLQKRNFVHYEISNFCKENFESKHNLVYWHNEKYYGFGLGASGYVHNIRYTNTRSMYNYLKGQRTIEQEKILFDDKISYELILGFRLINGINKNSFYNKYHCDLIDQFNIKELIDKGYLVDTGDNIKINQNYLYVENKILENFVE